MKSRGRRRRAVVQQIKRHGELAGPLSRAGKRAYEFTKIVCPACEKKVLPKRLTDHYLIDHPEMVVNTEEVQDNNG